MIHPKNPRIVDTKNEDGMTDTIDIWLSEDDTILG